MGVPLFQVDAFTTRAFAGNPAAVCLLDADVTPTWMQSVAAEMNLSETAFVRALGGTRYQLRWFTPTVEVDLCGHATLASAHVLITEGRADAGAAIEFETRSGTLTAVQRADRIELDFPTQWVTPTDPEPDLVAAVGAEPKESHAGGGRWLLELADELAVRAVDPDFAGLVPFGIVVVTSTSDDPMFDFVSRCFGPAHGIDEDPVTGSTHCVLSAYWSERLGKRQMTGYQASARGGIVTVRLEGDRTILGGQAVTVLRGELVSPR